MKVYLFLVSMSLPLLSVWPREPSANLPTPEEGEISVFVLLGQSNMVGAGRVHQLQGASLPQPREDILYSYKLPPIPLREEAREVASDGFGPLGPVERTGGQRWGMELTLGPALADTYLPDSPVALIKFARGASNLHNDWHPESDHGERLYERSLHYIRAQLKELRARGLKPELKGAFWFQGERDSSATAEEASAYEDNLKQLISAYRTDFNVPRLPFVLARVNPTKPNYTQAGKVRAAIVDVANADPNTAWINVDDLVFPDRLHVDGPSQFIVGRRAARAWANLALKEDSRSKPNILFLFAEQHHPEVLSPAGHPVIKTPSLQRLADEGVFFDNAYCPTPLCMPSRTSTLLGRFSHDTGILDNDKAVYEIGDQPNLARRLNKAGYLTCHIGKTHLATQWDESFERFQRLGFEDNITTAGKIGVANGWDEDPYVIYLKEQGVHGDFVADYQRRNRVRKEEGNLCDTTPSALDLEHYHDQWVSRTALEWIEAYDDDRPFYLSVNWVGPHVYRDPPEPYASMYDPGQMDPPISTCLDKAPEQIRKRQQRTLEGTGRDCWRKMRAAYYGQVSLVDDGVGKILEALEKKGFLENTLIVYSADHGEMLFDHGLLNKTLMYESSVGVPFIVRYPKSFPEGLRPESFASLVDLAPTFLEWAEADTLPGMQGRSLTPILMGLSDDREEVFSEFREMRMIRKGPWKYVTDPSWKVSQLFNLDDDPEELENVVHTFPEIAERLDDRLQEWLAGNP